VIPAMWVHSGQTSHDWYESGLKQASVVLLADWNVDVRGEKTRKYMADLGMREVITEFHGDAGPCTYNRGSNPIDGIFMTQDLYIVQGRYMPFGMGIGSDHRCLWLDIRTMVLMGQELEQSRKFAARWLKCDDPRVRNKYMQHYEQYIEKKQLRERIRKLASGAKELGLTQQKAQEYEQLDALQKKEFTKHNNNAGNSVQGKRVFTKNETTWNQSTFLEVGMQQGIWGQGSMMVSCKAM
jgi:hypothetical protein